MVLLVASITWRRQQFALEFTITLLLIVQITHDDRRRQHGLSWLFDLERYARLSAVPPCQQQPLRLVDYLE